MCIYVYMAGRTFWSMESVRTQSRTSSRSPSSTKHRSGRLKLNGTSVA